MTRDELEERVGLDLGPWGGMLIDAAHRGLVVDPGNGTLSHGDLWTGGCRPCIEGDAMTTLVERYLRAYGPATSRDVAHWGGIGVREADRHLEALDTRSISCRGGMMHLMEDDIDRLLGTGPPKRGWPSILLYRFDPLLLAYRDKSWIVPEGLQRRVWTSGGHVSGVVLEKGSAAGVWSYGRRGAGYAVRADLFGRCLKRTERAIASFERYLDLFFDARRR